MKDMKTKHDLQEMRLTQAINWLEEFFKKYDLNDNDSTMFKELLGVLRREEKTHDKVSKRWNIVKDNLTKGQVTRLIEEL